MQKRVRKATRLIDLTASPNLVETKPFLSTPIEVTRDKLRLMNMVDENIIIIEGSQYIKQDCE